MIIRHLIFRDLFFPVVYLAGRYGDREMHDALTLTLRLI